ncbi:hypothetical protein PFFVO_04220 [Plasmodium falciparum Vietnam Oak-Knoll (FVO)]|uniref:Uncharacterized protein n=1 Tax=Plasmodium falciparum Vietnam Oak-Knoll (FVO) TaxID=1036723 RepID=A0A024V403_PLAFA|nr:hypothetical protein PFFVO_04220 [Plasmodium falciparum Vietnam Oak-Knoll (FVO)]
MYFSYILVFLQAYDHMKDTIIYIYNYKKKHIFSNINKMKNTFSPSTAFLNDNNINIEIEYSNNVNKNNFFEILKEQS